MNNVLLIEDDPYHRFLVTELLRSIKPDLNFWEMEVPYRENKNYLSLYESICKPEDSLALARTYTPALPPLAEISLITCDWNIWAGTISLPLILGLRILAPPSCTLTLLTSTAEHQLLTAEPDFITKSGLPYCPKPPTVPHLQGVLEQPNSSPDLSYLKEVFRKYFSRRRSDSGRLSPVT